MTKLLDSITQEDLDKAISAKQEKEISIADEAIDWLRKERNCQLGKLSGSEQWMTCPQCQDSKIDNFSINIESLKFKCFKTGCNLEGIGLNGPKGLKAKLGYEYKSVPDSHSNQNTKTAEKKEKEQPYLLSKVQANELLIPANDFLASDEPKDEDGRALVNGFIEIRNYDKSVFLNSFDVRVAQKGTKFEQDIFATDKPFTITAPSLVWCLTDGDGNVLHMLRRPLGIDDAKTYNSCGSKRIYLSKPPDYPIFDGIFIVEGITCGTATAHFCQSAVLLGSNITQEYVQSEQLEIFRDKDVVYGVDPDVPDEKVQESMEILSQYAKSIIRLKAKQPQGSDGKYDWNDMLIDGRDELKEYIIDGIKTATSFIPSQKELAEKEKKEAVVAVKRELQPLKAELAFPQCAWRGLFETYRQAHEGTTEAPDQYHFAVFKTVAGAIVGRSCWLWNGRHLYPNFYTVLIGPSRTARKTTAKSKGEALLADTDPLVIIQRGLATPEGLIGRLMYPPAEELDDEELDGLPEIERQRAVSISDHEGYRTLVFVNEFASLLKKAKKESSQGIIQTLTDAYDCGPTLDNPTLTKPLSAINPFVAFVGLSTQDWLERSLEVGDVYGGYVNRHTFYLWTPTGPIHNPPEPDEKLLGQIKQQLHEIRNAKFGKHVKYTFSQKADAILKDWYDQNYYAEYESEIVEAAVQRVDENMRKLSLLYAVLENEIHDTEIHSDQLEAALEVGKYWEAATIEIFGKFGFSKQSRSEMRMLEVIKEKRRTKRELQQRLGGVMSAAEFNQTLDALVKAERIGFLISQDKKRQELVCL